MDITPIVKNYMTTDLITLKDEMDVYFAIGLLLKNNISGSMLAVKIAGRP